jgi:tetratricopeptide (TPR) repeat protein
MYLAYNKRPISREKLMFLFWPEESESVGRRRLREVLSKLRAELPDSEILITDHDLVGLDREHIWVDALEFADLFKQISPVAAQTPRSGAFPETTYLLMQRAIKLWRAAHFMAGASLPESSEFDRWLTESAYILEHDRTTMLGWLADHAAATGNLDEAIRWSRMILEVDEFNVEVNRNLLAWLSQQGRRSEALSYIDYLHKLYQREGYSDLPRILEDIGQRIRSQASIKEVVEHPLWPPPALLQTSFTGREKELIQFRRAFQRGGIILLNGQFGTGKSRMVYEAYRQIDPSPRLMVATAREMEGTLPLQPIIELLRHSITEDEWRKMKPTWISPLLTLLPELSSYLSTTLNPPDVTGIDAISFLFESFHQILRSLAARSRILFLLDNAQWSDKTTFEALSYLVERNFFDNYGLLVLASRPEEYNPNLADFITNMRLSHVRFDEIQLSEFTPSEVAELVASILRRTFDEEIIQYIHENTGGNPLFVIETLRTFLEYSPDIDLAEGLAHMPLPDSIQTLVRRRLQRLTLQTRNVLSAASVAGLEFSPRLLQTATDMELEQIVRSFEELEAARLIRPLAQDASTYDYTFVYPRIRQSLIMEMSKARRQMLHLRLARAFELEAGAQGRKAALVARHFEYAGDLKKAFDYWQKAACYAHKLHSVAEAYQSFQQAEKLLNELDNVLTDLEIFKLYSDWGNLADEMDDIATQYRIYSALQNTGNRRESHLLVGTALNGLSRAYRNDGEYHKGLDYVQRAIDHLEKGDHVRELVRAYNRLTLALVCLDRYEEAQESFKYSHELVDQNLDIEVQDALGSTLVQIADIYNYKGLPHRAVEMAELSTDRIAKLFSNAYQGSVQVTQANAYFLIGYFTDSIKMCHKALETAQELMDKRLEAYTQLVYARAAMTIGHLDESLSHIERALDTSKQYRFQDLMEQAYFIQGEFYRMAHNYTKAMEAHDKALLSPAPAYNRLDNRIRLGFTMIRQGHDIEGMKILTQATAEARKYGFAYVSLSGDLLLGGELSKRGEYDQADEIFTRVQTEVGQRGLVGLRGNAYLYSGMNALFRGKLKEARQQAEMVIEYASQRNYVWLEVAGQKLLYNILVKEGRQDSQPSQRILELKDIVLDHTTRQEIVPDVEKYFYDIIQEMI